LDKIRTKKTLLLAGAILASALFIMPSPTMVCSRNVMDASINVSMEPFRAFVGDNLPKNNVPWDLPCKVFFWDWRLLRIKTTVNFTYLGVDNTAPLGIILIQLNTPFILVESHLL
jgi:maltose/moltooligosaccharide transporter